MYKLKYLKDNWKLIIHLLFRTKRFGVNNKIWSSFDDTLFGVSNKRIIWDIIRIYPIYKNFEMMRFRANIGFVSKETCKKLGISYERER